MTESTAIWTVLGLFAAVLGFFARYFIRKIDKVSEGHTETQLTEFRADYFATRKGWELWRAQLEIEIAELFKENRDKGEQIARILGRLNGNHK